MAVPNLRPGARIGTSRLHRLASADGLELAVETWPGSRPTPLIFAHGFGQTRHAWSGTASRLATQGWICHAADGRGHGDSGWLPGGRYGFDQFVGDVAALMRHAGRRPVWIGASMGGLLGLAAEAESQAGLFDALVLVDITPRWEAQGVARIMDFMRAHPEGFASVADAQAAVATYLPHRAQRKSPERLEKLLVRTDAGRWRWHWDPALLDTIAHQAPQWSERLHAAARRLRLPVLLVSGGRSDVVSDHTIAEFLELVPHAEHGRIADATHMVAGDANDRFGAVIADFLERLPARSGPTP